MSWCCMLRMDPVFLYQSLKSSAISPLYDSIPLMTLMRLPETLPVMLLIMDEVSSLVVVVFETGTPCLVEQCSPLILI